MWFSGMTPTPNNNPWSLILTFKVFKNIFLFLPFFLNPVAASPSSSPLPLSLLPLFLLLLLHISHLRSLSSSSFPSVTGSSTLHFLFLFLLWRTVVQHLLLLHRLKKKRRERRDKEKKRKDLLEKRTFPRQWLQVIPSNNLPYAKIRAPYSCKGSAQAVKTAHTQYPVCDGSYRGWILLGSGAWKQPQMVQAITHYPEAAQPSPHCSWI